PGADYSRFSHCLGVCHVTGRILEAIKANSSVEISGEEIRDYRLAGLLHDLGHYPFSHPMEDAIKDYFSQKLIQPKSAQAAAQGVAQAVESPTTTWHKHEKVGEVLLATNPELKELLTTNGVDPAKVYSIFNRREPPRFSNLVSSDLDADRIDYLLRTALHTGLPYGSVDLDYLLSQMRLDSNDQVCITEKALRTADHFLLCRYFDYQQVSYHKTVAGLEWLLKDVIAELLRTGGLAIDGSAGSVDTAIVDGEWAKFDDISTFTAIQTLANSTQDEIVRLQANAIINRMPPKLVACFEYLGDGESKYDDRRKLIKAKVSQWADKFGIDLRLWHIWSKATKLTKTRSRVPVSSAGHISAQDQDNIEQSIRILKKNADVSCPIVEDERALMSILADYSLHSLRIYVLLDAEKASRRTEIEQTIQADISAC
ncbi:MAG TPA: HD domain-containing protein, partial [Pirellulales bacterium]|nr:HD domain-containing protein [Pirellulales bacterium]